MPNQKIRAAERTKFHGYGMEAPLSMLKENLWNAERVELFPSERIVFLDVRFGELFRKCSEEEWNDFQTFLATHGISVEPKTWWKSWRR